MPNKENDKKNILDSWIMVELLSEGDINISNKAFFKFDELSGNDYFAFFENHLSKKRSQKRGLALYLDIFEFGGIIDFLRDKFKLTKPEEEVPYGSKFNFALYFDKDLNFLSDLTFFTVSGFIQHKNKVPTLKEFHDYETELKTKLEQYFENEDENVDENSPEQNSAKKQNSDPAKFNDAIQKVLNLTENEINLDNCRIQVINNIESDAINLHSFFIEDLEKAKNISTENLDKYLLGDETKRINLDSKKDSASFHPDALSQILTPSNYPLGRFPSNTQYALSFMQQIAVNLSIGLDSNQIRSVNGPPGTGKTTLLKDIFAELIVKQAYAICKLSPKEIRGNEDTQYYEKASIGVVPENIAQNNIVVASSNNGAVQNIVNELPLLSGIADSLIDEITAVDYFKDISNSSVESDWQDGKETIMVTPQEDLNWGLFSLEGGRSDNMKNILTCLKAVVQHFDSVEFEPNPRIYEDFEKQYLSVKNHRDKVNELFALSEELKKLQDKMQSSEIDIKKWQMDRDNLESQSKCIQQKIDEANVDYKRYSELLRDANNNKPKGFFGLFVDKNEKEEFLQKHDFAQNRTMEALNRLEDLKGQQEEIQGRLEEIRNLEAQHKAQEMKICELKEKVAAFENVNVIDFNQSYDDLQKSNPWYNEDYRILQSKLFIAALSVRKQFLYDNRRNIKAAVNIWSNQNNYLEKKHIIVAAWKWINLTIPVISSTFASFSRMCKNLEANSLGQLFIDEAGQALPQASVGAIFRSQNVMVVGDPAQIKPVLTLEPGVLGILKDHFNVSEKYLSDSASTQTLVDAVSQYGYYRDADKSDSSWIGIPLWVHRRCQYPMFSISNRISYNDMMVQGNPVDGKAGWYDIKGKANNKYVEEQGEFLLNKIQKLIRENPNITNKEEKDVIYVISPFSNVAVQLAKKLDDIGFTRRDSNNKPTNIGTVHTFQGKEAPIVFMVLGADNQSRGAAAWAVTEPNMMNVAATRAKKEFYIVGDKDLYLNLGSDVAKDTYRVIMAYKKAHPDLVVCTEKPQIEHGTSPIPDQSEATSIQKTPKVAKEKSHKTPKNSKSRYIGNRTNNSFHLPNCKFAPKNPQKRVEFLSREDAIESGFKPCNTCNA